MRREWSLLKEEAGARDLMLDGVYVCCAAPDLAQFLCDAANAAEQRKEWELSV